MLDIILIQHAETGINILEYRQEKAKFDSKHSEIFSGFLSAIQNISIEINIGRLVLISTKGENGHNCIIVESLPINVILLADTEDPIDHWREKGEIIAKRFISMFGFKFNPNNIMPFQEFKSVIRTLI